MTNNDFGLSEIGQIAVRVRDIARAVEFYRDKLGMKFLFQAGTLAFFQCGAIRLMLGVPESSKLDHPSSILYFKVQGIEAAAATLKERGVKFDSEPHVVHHDPGFDLWMASFYDADDNTLALMEERRK